MLSMESRQLESVSLSRRESVSKYFSGSGGPRPLVRHWISRTVILILQVLNDCLQNSGKNVKQVDSASCPVPFRKAHERHNWYGFSVSPSSVGVPLVALP